VVPDKWRTMVDRTSGVRFELPGAATMTRRASTTPTGLRLEKRIYSVDIAPGQKHEFGVSVSIVSGKPNSVTFAGANLAAIPDELRTQFRTAGVTDCRILEERRQSVAGHRALDFRVSFTPTDHTADKVLWFARVIDDHLALVLMQTIAFPPRGQDPVYEPELRRIHQRLLAGIRL
jgi:hypothetical protein